MTTGVVSYQSACVSTTCFCVAHAGCAVKEGHTKGLCPTVEESA